MAARRAGSPEFLVLGHVTQDIVGEDRRPGGTASYAAVVAARLGLRTAVLTSAAPDFVPPAEMADVALHSIPAEQTTVMEHRWYGRRREQYRRSRARTIAAADVPAELRAAGIVLFGPVVDEVSVDAPSAFPGALRGATIQGWLRRAGADQHVEPVDAAAWAYRPLLSGLSAAFLSEEDLDLGAKAAASILETWEQAVPILAITRGDAGARLGVHGHWYSIAALPAREVDGTGAGDAFAAGFLIRYHETADAGEAARFATAVASFVVEAPGIAGAPTRTQVESRLAAHPEVRLVPAGSGR